MLKVLVNSIRIPITPSNDSVEIKVGDSVYYISRDDPSMASLGTVVSLDDNPDMPTVRFDSMWVIICEKSRLIKVEDTPMPAEFAKGVIFRSTEVAVNSVSMTQPNTESMESSINKYPVFPIITQNVDRAVTAKEYEQFGNKLLVTSFFRTIQGEGPYSGHPSIFLRLAGCNFGAKTDMCTFCFPTTKTINTPQGIRALGDLKVGDSLFTLDENYKVTTTTIKKRMTRKVAQSELVRITYESSKRVGAPPKRRSIVCTEEHPFDVKNKGFVSAKDLVLNDVIYHAQSNDIMSLQKKLRNPMHDSLVAKGVAAKIREMRANGKFKEYTRTPWQRKNLSELRKVRNPMFSAASQLKMLKSKVYPKSKTEILVEKLFKLIDVAAVYTGNKRSFILGNENIGYARPDFIIGKKVFEIYDTTYPHYAEGFRNKANYEILKRRFYKKLGYEVCFITEHTLGGKFKIDETSKVKFALHVNKFLKNGARVVGVEYLDSKGFSQLDVQENGKVEVVNFSCAPYNTYLVDGLHTHNCDTSFQFDQGKLYAIEDLIKELTDLEGYSPNDVLVITGGEPTLQISLLELIVKSRQYFKEIQIETNGTRPQFFKAAEERNMISLFKTVVSPKASYKANRYPLTNDRVRWYASCFKFVVDANPDSPHHEVPEWALDRTQVSCPVYVSPMAVYLKPYAGEVSSIWEEGLINKEATAENYNYAAKYAMKHNLLLSLQTHLFIGLA